MTPTADDFAASIWANGTRTISAGVDPALTTETLIICNAIWTNATRTLTTSSKLKTWNGIAYASLKTLDGIPIASVKTWDGL